MSKPVTATMRTLRCHSHGEWADVLHREDASVPNPQAGQIRVRVHACALKHAHGKLVILPDCPASPGECQETFENARSA